MVKYPTLQTGMTRKERKRAFQTWYDNLSPEDQRQVDADKSAEMQKGKRKYETAPPRETPKRFSKEELRKIDWDNT